VAFVDLALSRVVIDTTGCSDVEGSRIDPLKTLAEVDEHHPVRVVARELKIRCFALEDDRRLEALNYLKAICRNLKGVKSFVCVLNSAWFCSL
jgi:hypothetical protein